MKGTGQEPDATEPPRCRISAHSKDKERTGWDPNHISAKTATPQCAETGSGSNPVDGEPSISARRNMQPARWGGNGPFPWSQALDS